MQKQASTEVLKACLHRYMEDGPRTRFSKRSLLAFAKGDLATLRMCLEEWQSKDYLRILRPLAECRDEEDCIEMKSFIGQKSPIRGFLNWQ
jgi:hypothetical protein